MTNTIAVALIFVGSITNIETHDKMVAFVAADESNHVACAIFDGEESLTNIVSRYRVDGIARPQGITNAGTATFRRGHLFLDFATPVSAAKEEGKR